MTTSGAFLEGNLVHLRGVRRTDVPIMAAWTDDRVVTRFLSRGAQPASVERSLAQFDRATQGPADDIELAICLKGTDAPVGITGIHGISPIARSAEFRILIGDKAAWGKGIGTEVTQLMAVYAFEVLNLNKLALGVNSSNVGAVRAYEKAGFVTEGVLREDTYRNRRYYDSTCMSMLRREYEEKWSTWAIAPSIRLQFPG